MSKGPDWIAIEGAYRAGTQSLREIAKRYGTAEGTIRSRAKKHGWVQDAAGTKRRIVADGMAGITQDVAQCAMREIESAAEADLKDMNTGLRIYRHILCAMEEASSTVQDPRDAKVITEATEKAINGIRTIRGLDAPSDDKELVVSFPDSE